MLLGIVFFLGEVVQVYELYLLIRCFFKKRMVPGWGEWLAYAGLFVLKTVPYLLFGIPAVTIIFSYLGSILVTLIYEGSWKKKILCATLTFVIFALTECLLAVLTGYINRDIFKSEYYDSIFGMVGLPIVGFLIVMIIRNYKNLKDGEEVSGSYWLMSIMLPVLLFVLFMLFYRQDDLNSADLILCACILFLLNVFVFYLYNHQMEVFRVKREKEALELQNQHQMNQLKLMNQTVEQSRGQSHDFLKHISMISYMNEQQDRERLAAYLEEIQNHIVRLRMQLLNSGNAVLDGILNFKMQQAAVSGIYMDVSVDVPEQVELSVYDMNIILSNLLDNSIEALLQNPMEDKQIGVKISYNKHRLKIRVRNSYDGETLVDDEGNFITRKTNKQLHGYGIRNVKNIVEKYEGMMEIRRKDAVFEVFICLFLR